MSSPARAERTDLVKLDQVQAAIGAVVQTAAPSAVYLWAPAEYPSRALGAAVVTAEIVRGPDVEGMDGGYSSEPTAITWTADGAGDVGDPCGLVIAGWWYASVREAGDDVTDLRDDVLSQLEDAGWDATASGAASIEIVAVAPGLLWGLREVGESTIDLDTVVDCESMTGTARMVVELQAYCGGTARVEAQQLLSQIAGQIGTEDVIQARATRGLAIAGIDPVINIRAVDGAGWESRAAMRLRCSARSYSARAVGVVDSAVLSAEADTIPIEIEVP